MTLGALARFAHRIPAPVLEDLGQEAWLRTFTARDVRHPRAYANRAARNLAIDWLRHSAREEALETEPGTSPWAAVDARLDVDTAFGAGPDSCCQLLRRHFLGGEPLEVLIEEVAGGPRAVVGEPTWQRARDTLYKRRRRSLERLAQILGA